MKNRKPQQDIRHFGLTEDNFLQVLDSIQDLIFVKNRNSEIVWANKSFCEYFGLDRSMPGATYSSQQETADMTAKYMTDDQQVFATGKLLDIPQEKIMSVDGVAEFFHTVKAPLFGENGRVDFLVGVSRSIQSQVDVQIKFERSQKLLNVILDEMPAVIYAKDKAGKYILVNRQYETIFDLKRSNILGKSDFDLFAKEIAEGFAKNDKKVLSQAMSLQCEEKAPHVDGIHTYLSTKFPLLDEEGLPYAVSGVSTDITDRLKMQKELEEERARSVANSKMAALGEMSGGIAHEINTPLATLKTLCSQLKEIHTDNLNVDKQTISEMLEIFEKTTDHIAKVVKNIRMFGRDGSKDEFEEFDLNEVVKDTLLFCSSLFLKHKIEVLWTPESRKKIFGRKIEISQVVLNLIGNSIDAISLQSERWIKIECQEKDNSILLLVTDSGGGIPRHVLPKIFDVFFTTKPPGKGTGLGLVISKRTIDEHQGKIRVNTDCPNTQFVVELPKAQKNVFKKVG